MTIIRNCVLVVSTAVLGACSTAPPAFAPAISGTAQVDASNSYSVTQNGITKTLGLVDVSIVGTSFLGFTTTSLGVVYKTADVLAIAGKDIAGPSYTTYAGISGTPSTTVPTTASGTYTGRFNVSFYRGGTLNQTYWSGGPFTTNVDFDTGTLTGSGTGGVNGNLTVTGTLSGAYFNGTADFTALEFAGATNVPMTGGFYGANDVVGILQDGQVAGVFYGQ